MRTRVLVLGAAVLLGLALSGCGGQSGSDAGDSGTDAGKPAPRAGKGLDLDKVDPCALVSDAELQQFFGEAPGEKTPSGGAFLKGCSIDNESEIRYVFVSVQAPPTGDKTQLDFDRSTAKNVAPVAGVGDEGFSAYDDDEAEVEVRHRGAVFNFSLQLYSVSETLSDPGAVVAGLTTLAKQALART